MTRAVIRLQKFLTVELMYMQDFAHCHLPTNIYLQLGLLCDIV